MESDNEERKTFSTNTRKHIAKLHERVQVKYEEMQRKLHKSKSTDILSSLNDDDVFNNYTKYVSTSEINKVGERSEKLLYGSAKRESIVFESAKKSDLMFSETKNEVQHPEPHSATILNNLLNEGGVEQKHNDIFFFDVPFKGSLESLNEEAKDSDESLEITAPTYKSLRSRIGSKIREARQRRHNEKEKSSKIKKDTRDRVERFILSNTTKENIGRVVHKKTKLGCVSLGLVEINGFEETEEEKPRSLSCRFRLGSEKRKSKLIKSHATSVKFQEIHDFSLFDDDYNLEIVVWDRDIQVGRTIIDLFSVEKEKTHKIRINLEESDNIIIFILLTISGIATVNTIYNINENETKEEEEEMKNKFKWYRLSGQFTNVGWMSVTVYGAKGLSTNDCFCILSVDNEWKFTATDYKTNAPNWMKVFTFEISDITSHLEVTIYDEKKSEIVGRISIPLLSIEPGKKWFALKDSTQRDRAKGNNPRILLEMKVVWNLVKASFRVINPKETNLLQPDDKLDRHILVRNISRGRVVTMWVVNAFRVIKTCFEWESRKWNLISLTGWLILCYTFRTWMIPLILIVPFFFYRPKSCYLINWKNLGLTTKTETTSGQKEKEDRSLRQRFHDYQEMIQTVQNFIGNVATLGESVKNLYNFSVPFVSFLAIFLILTITFVMYLIPLRYILMAWGIHKFTRKILKPNRIPHSEILDLLSRVSDDIALQNYQELTLENNSDDEL